MQQDINKYINSYVNILHRLYKECHAGNASMYKYVKVALTIDDILYKIKSDYDITIVMIVLYKVNVLTNNSFGPISKTLKDEILNCGAKVTHEVNVQRLHLQNVLFNIE